MASKTYRIIAPVLAALATLAANVAQGQQVEITSKDQTVRIIGDLVDFDGVNYTLRTSLGDLNFVAADVSCSGTACPYIKPPTSEFAIAGSRSLSELLIPALINSYSGSLDARIGLGEGEDGRVFTLTDDENDDLAKMEVIASDSSNGLSSLLQGDSSLALSTRPARSREAQAFEATGLGNIRDASQEHVLALDGLIIITSPDNPVRAISEENAALVFGGEITNWREIGGADAPIRVYARGESSGTAEQFFNLLLRPQGLNMRDDAIVVDSDDEISQAVAKDPFGIGFTSFIHRNESKSLAIEGVCGLQVPASEFAIKTEEYPLARRLYAYSSTRSEPHHVNAFLEFAGSQEAQRAVREAGFIDQSISKASVGTQGLRFASAIVANRNAAELPELQRMVSDMINSERLSSTFRFLQGSSQLDTRAQADIGRLAKELNRTVNSGKIVQLIGFTDSIGDPFLNKQLSERRAAQVRDALLSQDPTLQDKISLEIAGYGEVSPLGCNETAEGRLINRRVEVWVKEDLTRASN